METVKAPDSQPELVLERLIRENEVPLKRLCYLYLHDEGQGEYLLPAEETITPDPITAPAADRLPGLFPFIAVKP